MKMRYKEQAIGEAINWWLHDEYFYHNLFSQLDRAIDEIGMDFVSNHIFAMFLKQYSVRRTLEGGSSVPGKFLEAIRNLGFYKSAIDGNTKVIDELHDRFEHASNTSVKSALSKFAVMCNPAKFVMYDKRSRKGMHHILNTELNERTTYKKIDHYQTYVKLAQRIAEEYTDKEVEKALAPVKSDSRVNLFIKNKKAFKLRIADKLCWLNGYDRNNDPPEEFEMSTYIELFKYRGSLVENIP